MHRLRRQMQSAGSAPSPQRRLRTVEAEIRRHGCAGGSQQASPGTVQSNRYRTLCVRKCDGYFFPLGFATPKSKLDRDEAVCQAFYPEGEGELYIHASGSDEEEAAMTSLDGEAYADESFAFAYRSAYRPACAALLRDGIRPDKPDEKGDTTVTMDLSSAVPIPVPRPSLPEESHTVAGAGGDAIASGIEETDPAAIRVVGPATPYLVGKPADGAATPLASAPERVQPPEDASWSDRVTGFVAPAAQAGEAGE